MSRRSRGGDHGAASTHDLYTRGRSVKDTLEDRVVKSYGRSGRSITSEKPLVRLYSLVGRHNAVPIMMKYAVTLACAICLVQSQRPPYAGSSNRYPVVLPQFLDGREDVAAGTAVVNRIDADADRSSTIPPDLPVDALGDVNLVNRIKTWPKEKQPFWFINWQQIQEHRGDANNRAQPVQTQPNTRSSFAG